MGTPLSFAIILPSSIWALFLEYSGGEQLILPIAVLTYFVIIFLISKFLINFLFPLEENKKIYAVVYFVYFAVLGTILWLYNNPSISIVPNWLKDL